MSKKVVYMKKVKDKPHPESSPYPLLFKGTTGKLIYKENIIISSKSGQSEKVNGYQVKIWENNNGFIWSSKNVKLLTVNCAKKWVKRIFGGKWKFSKKEFT